MAQNNNTYQNNQVQSPKSAHAQPQAVEMERAILGAEMIDRDAYPLVAETVPPESFYEPRHQLIQSAIKKLYDDHRNTGGDGNIDILTVTDMLARMGKLEEVGGPGYMAELSSRVASSAHVDYHARVVAQMWAKRRMIKLCSDSEAKGFNETEDIDDVLNELEAGVSELRDYRPNKEIKKAIEYAKEAIAEIQAAAANSDGISGIASFPSLDEKTNGWQNSDLIIIAGRPSEGKTAFALTLATIISVYNNVPAAFFSIEMSGSQLMKRVISCISEVDGTGLTSGQLLPVEWERIDKMFPLICDAPLFIDQTPNLTVQEFRTRARKLAKEGVKIFFVDYLQLMHYSGKRFNNRQEEVSEISRALKAIAKELNVPIIVLSQLNRGLENREGLEGKKPRLSDLRESGAIEQDADIVIFVYRPERHGILQDENGRSLIGVAKILIEKHRKGPTGEINMTFLSNYTRFVDGDWKPLYNSRKDESANNENKAMTTEDGEPLPF